MYFVGVTPLEELETLLNSLCSQGYKIKYIFPRGMDAGNVVVIYQDKD